LFRSQNYLGGVVCFRRSQALAVGGCEDELDGDCAWGLFLRLTSAAPGRAIHHLPFILSHRKDHAQRHDDPGRRARVARALERRLAGIGARVSVEPVGRASYRTRYRLAEKPPTVSVVIPTAGKLDFLRPCLGSIVNRTSYPELEIILVVDRTRVHATEQQNYLDSVAAQPQVRLLFTEERPYNFSRVNNHAAEHARGELICFLNDDTEVIATDWLLSMVSEAMQERVGAVGAMLVYPNERIQHAGVILGVGGVAAHTYRGRPRRTSGYHDRALIAQDVSCVTAACMLVRRDAFTEARGFDVAFAFAFSDVDLCLRLREAGWRVVWTPSAELYHKESASMGLHHAGEREQQWAAEWDLVHSRWGEQLMSDPHYSPNLALDALRFWEPAFPPRVSYPWRSCSSEHAAEAGPPRGREG
jgi:GT2 family glycosyltransferase